MSVTDVTDVTGALVGDYAVYGDHADRIEGLVETQASAFVAGRSNWLVLPWRPSNGEPGFYLFSEDREGQRRGREVLNGFLGPSVARLVTMPDHLVEAALDSTWAETGLVKASLVQRRPEVDRAEMLLRLEDLVATMAGRPTVIDEVRPTHIDLLRDVRLAMLGNDSTNAQRLLDQLVLTGEISAENLRFLTVELFAAFGRWQEMADLPYINVLMLARRPRAISESLLKMIWWTEIIPYLGTAPVSLVFASRGVLTRYGGILRTIQVPSSSHARVLAFLTAIEDDDAERQAAILEAAADDAERESLAVLASGDAAPERELEPKPEPESAAASIRGAIGRGKFKEAVDLFLEDPTVEFAGAAVDAILEIKHHDRAGDVLALVRGWVGEGEIDPSRRLRRDLDDLNALVSGACVGWPDWAKRVGSADRWADASAVLRDQHQDWDTLGALPANQVSVVADEILAAVGSTNEDQLRASLDVLCRVAAEVVENPACAPFFETVLEILADQENISGQVRDAYVRLFEAVLGAGPSKSVYDEMLTKTTALWDLVRARQHVDWALELLDAVGGASAPDAGSRNAFGMPIIQYLRSMENLGLRQLVEIESLAVEFGLPRLPVEVAVDAEEESVWKRLDGTIVGLYTLLSHAVPRFTSRLKELCSPGEIVGNADTTATGALTSLAERADHLVVDTWHAAHQATNAINSVRSKDEQVLPQQRGVTGFLRALEARLEN